VGRKKEVVVVNTYDQMVYIFESLGSTIEGAKRLELPGANEKGFATTVTKILGGKENNEPNAILEFYYIEDYDKHVKTLRSWWKGTEIFLTLTDDDSVFIFPDKAALMNYLRAVFPNREGMGSLENMEMDGVIINLGYNCEAEIDDMKSIVDSYGNGWNIFTSQAMAALGGDKITSPVGLCNNGDEEYLAFDPYASVRIHKFAEGKYVTREYMNVLEAGIAEDTCVSVIVVEMLNTPEVVYSR
jgi:hypothetical protein